MDELVSRLAQQVGSKYYGKYRGFVSDNKDPEKRGRLKLLVPSLLGDQATTWALPCVPFGGLAGQGWFVIPEVDAQVWAEFEEGDLRRPIWTGTFWQTSDDVPDDASRDEPTMRLLATPSGHALELDDADGQETVTLHHKTGAELTIDKNGTLSVTDAKGGSLVLDANAEKVTVEDTNGNKLTMSSDGTTVEDGNGNKIELGSAGVKLSAMQIVLDGQTVQIGGQGGEPVLKGQSFLTLFSTHTHTVAAFGPTSPPVPQGVETTLSTAVTTK